MRLRSQLYVFNSLSNGVTINHSVKQPLLGVKINFIIERICTIVFIYVAMNKYRIEGAFCGITVNDLIDVWSFSRSHIRFFY